MYRLGDIMIGAIFQNEVGLSEQIQESELKTAQRERIQDSKPGYR
jgi:hypothetical protein